jgi:hypothetical protein
MNLVPGGAEKMMVAAVIVITLLSVVLYGVNETLDSLS